MASSTSAARDNRSWFPECNHFLNEICSKIDLDISNNRRIERFMEIVATNEAFVNEEMLDYLGYSGKYSEKENAFARLLLENPKIKYKEILDENDINKKNYILNGNDFESVIMRSGTPKALELLLLISLIKSSRLEYYRHIEFCLEEQLLDVEVEKRRAEERSQEYMEQLQHTVDVLRNDIALRVTPHPINKNKIRCLGLYASSIPGEWYLMRRQEEGWSTGERKLERRKMKLLKKWSNVSHAVDIANDIKRHSREELLWYAKDNLIKVSETAENSFHDADIVKLVTSIVEQQNDAHKLASEIVEKLTRHGQNARESSLTPSSTSSQNMGW